MTVRGIERLFDESDRLRKKDYKEYGGHGWDPLTSEKWAPLYDHTLVTEFRQLCADVFAANSLSKLNTGFAFQGISEKYIDSKDLSDFRYLDSEIYGLYDDKNELIYIGSTTDPITREKNHRRAVANGERSRLYQHLQSLPTWSYRTIEKFPCCYKGHLEKREYELIEERRPWFNNRRLHLVLCDNGCHRIIDRTRYGPTCRICSHVHQQVKSGKLSVLPKLSEKRTQLFCALCGSHGMMTANEDQFECVMCNIPEKYDAVDVARETCMLRLVEFPKAGDKYYPFPFYVLGDLPEDHECTEACQVVSGDFWNRF